MTDYIDREDALEIALEGCSSEQIHHDLKRLPYVSIITCKDCKHRPYKNKDGYTMPPRVQVGVYAWGEPEYDDDETCPYVCEDRWYSRIPNDEQYCDRAEPKDTTEEVRKQLKDMEQRREMDRKK